MTNKKPSTSRIQSSLIKHLEKYGIIQLQLPDNFVLEVGINNDDDDSTNPKKTENYCYVIVKNLSLIHI